jgi:glycosyltransferase involved in cell wall biosynthesis
MAIHQLVSSLCYGDAVGNQALAIRRLLREWGIPSEILAAEGDARLSGEWIDFRAYPGDPNSAILFHYGIASPVTAWARDLPDRVVLCYHNITPAEYLAPYNADVARALERGRAELADFAHLPYALADSDYNRRELIALGFRRVDLLPLMLDMNELHASAQSPAGRALTARFTDDCVNILFVGRVAPNKRHDDLVKVFACYRRLVNPRSRLLIAGAPDHQEGYEFNVRRLVQELRVPDVNWLGHVAMEDGFGGLYRAAHVFLCLSEHEGFGVPLVEAMSFDVPVLALAAAAVPETLGASGVLITGKRYEAIAEVMDLVARDEGLRRRIIAGQRRRLGELSPERCAEQLRRVAQVLQPEYVSA